jgi:hypothetical protein
MELMVVPDQEDTTFEEGHEVMSYHNQEGEKRCEETIRVLRKEVKIIKREDPIILLAAL